MRTILLLLVLLVSLWSGKSAHAATSISQRGITLSWLEDLAVGTFFTGDYYIVAPSGVTLVGITPSTAVIGGYQAHGAMINPIANSYPAHGFYSRITGYSAAQNIALVGGNPLSPTNTRLVSAGSSICLSTSRTTAPEGEHSLIADFVVVTVLASAPPAGSFRPPYIGTDKTIRWNVSDLDYGVLRNLTTVTGLGAPTSAQWAAPWVCVSMQYNQARDFAAYNQQIEYDRDISWAIGAAILALNTNYTNAEKELGYARMVQYGIDMYAACKYGVLTYSGTNYQVPQENGGPKAAIVLAALALDDDDIRYYADAANKITSPWLNGGSTPVNRHYADVQHWEVTSGDVGRTVNYNPPDYPRVTYALAHVGLPEWGGNHEFEPQNDDSRWEARYRDVRYSGQVGIALAMQVTVGARELWNWPPFFNYIDRAYAIYTPVSGTDPTPDYVQLFWEAHRSVGGPVWPASEPPPEGNAVTAVTINAATFSVP